MNKIVDEVWGKWCSVPIVFIISILLGINTIGKIYSAFSESITDNQRTYLEPSNKTYIVIAIIIVCILVLNLCYIFIVYRKNHIKRARRKKTGILIYIDANDYKTYKDTVRKFGNEFNINLINKLEDIYIPFGVKPIEYKSDKVLSFLKRKRCILYLDIHIDADENDDSILYDMKINGSIIHAKYSKELNSEFQKVFSEKIHAFGNVIFKSNEMTKQLRVTAKDLSIACEYIIGLSLFLNANLKEAGDILDEWIYKCPQSEQWDNTYKLVQQIRYNIFIIYVEIYSHKYQLQYNNENNLDKMNEMLEKARDCCGETYEYCLNKAYYCIAKSQDVRTANELINKCKQMKRIPLIWKYSEAFLKAYKNQSLDSICKSYKSALRVPYNTVEIIEFIEVILQKESKRIGLYLALSILYRNEGDDKLADYYIDKYLSNVLNPQKAKELLIKKGLYK